MKKLADIIGNIRRRREKSSRLGKMQEASRRLQVREFGGQLCLAFDGIPILPMADFDNGLLNSARQTFLDYLTDNININLNLKQNGQNSKRSMERA